MKVKMKQVLVDYEGKPISDKKVVDNKVVDTPLIVREVLATSLANVPQNEQLVAEDKMKRHQLSIKLYASKEVELSLNERSYLTELVGKIFTAPLVYGRICEILDGKEQVVSKPEEPEKSKTTVSE